MHMNTTIKLFNTLLFLIVMIGCSLDIPPVEIEVPPIENNTTIIVQLPDGYSSASSIEEAADTQDPEEVTCAFKHMPDYRSHGGYIIFCTGTANMNTSNSKCCTWIFPEAEQVCEERWCLDMKNSCGWYLDSWSCYSN